MPAPRPLRLLPLLLALAAPLAAAADVPSFLLKWGTRGSGNGQFWVAWDVAIDAAGRVYVSDASSRVYRIQKFTADGGYLGQWGGMSMPRGLAFDAAERLHVCETGARRIARFDTDGASLGSVDLSAIAVQPYDVAVNAAGELFVTDLVLQAVLKFSAAGQLITAFGGAGAAPGQLDGPWSVALDGRGAVFVADRQNHRVQRFDENGVFQAVFGMQGEGPGQFIWPRGVALDPNGNVLVTDQMHRVQAFTRDGQFIHQFGSEGVLDGQFEFPTGLATRHAGGMTFTYVVDQESARIQKFGDGTVPAIPTSWGRIKALYRGAAGRMTHR